ncbi:MAG: zinc ribbon domain-containing protein [Chitinophagales bacterium]|nr:zinc ribbon domain-containing protein [Chitinophagales bacterium]
MAIDNICGQCGKVNARKSKFCFNCGSNLKASEEQINKAFEKTISPKKKSNKYKIVIVIAVLLALYANFSGGGSDYDKRKVKLEEQFHYNGSHIQLTRWIKNNMNNPKSYEHIKTVYWDMTDYLIVQTDYRGENAFGALVQGTVKAKVDNNGNIIEIIEHY